MSLGGVAFGILVCVENQKIQLFAGFLIEEGERETRFERATFSLARKHSTTELLPQDVYSIVGAACFDKGEFSIFAEELTIFLLRQNSAPVFS